MYMYNDRVVRKAGGGGGNGDFALDFSTAGQKLSLAL